MKKILLFVSLIIFLASCENSTVRERRKVYIKYFNDLLSDPKSLIIYNEKILSDNALITTFEVDYGAKNKVGGMMRNVRVFEIKENKIYKVDGKYYFVHLTEMVRGEELNEGGKKSDSTSDAKPKENKPQYKDIYQFYKDKSPAVMLLSMPDYLKRSIGKTAVMNQDMWAARDTTSLKIASYYISKSDKDGFNNLYHEDRIVLLSKGNKLKVMDFLDDHYKVKMLTGGKKNEVLYIKLGFFQLSD
jgi:hypothetical protein